MSTASSVDKIAKLFSFLRAQKPQTIVADQTEEAMMMVPVYEQLPRLADVRWQTFFLIDALLIRVSAGVRTRELYVPRRHV